MRVDARIFLFLVFIIDCFLKVTDEVTSQVTDEVTSQNHCYIRKVTSVTGEVKLFLLFIFPRWVCLVIG